MYKIIDNLLIVRSADKIFWPECWNITLNIRYVDNVEYVHKRFNTNKDEALSGSLPNNMKLANSYWEKTFLLSQMCPHGCEMVT